MDPGIKDTVLFSNIYRNKRVLVTGHTGFKGSWLCLWLHTLGARVAGFSIDLPSTPCHYQAIELSEEIQDYRGDVRDLADLRRIFREFKPEIVFHLAAQPLVRKSYDDPKGTFDTNAGGMVNILECIRASSSVETAVLITSDKCYQNQEWLWGYRETDPLGGTDPYSASKGCAEWIAASYIRSYFSHPDAPRIATARAGNVIGGGDWAEDRVIPDCVRAWTAGQEAKIRNPQATRPWQHVLEPLSGYLHLGACLYARVPGVTGEAFNFGPDDRVIEPVQTLVDSFLSYWKAGSWTYVPHAAEKKEASLLKLCCDKALHTLRWHSLLDFETSVRYTAEWYQQFYENHPAPGKISLDQIAAYTRQALENQVSWVGEPKENILSAAGKSQIDRLG